MRDPILRRRMADPLPGPEREPATETAPASHDGAALDALLDSPVDGSMKGYPHGRPPLRLGDVGRQGWTLAGDLDTPVALLKRSALTGNAAWMGEFLRRTGASLCPHGKTSMAPQLFHEQLRDGAWGITLATVQQARIARSHGVRRVLLANQLASAGAVDWVQEALDSDPGFDLTCLVDSVPGVELLERLATGRRPLPVLVELGVPGGRTGARDLEGALGVARRAHASERLLLRGVECYEGIVGSADAEADAKRVVRWLDAAIDLARSCAAEGLFDEDEVLLTAGGSAYFDLVAARLGAALLDRPARVLLRSGCYLFHDVSHYAELVARVEERLPREWRPPGRLTPAIEIWGRVLSRPEPGLAFLDFGKRDAPQDLGLPRPILWCRPGEDGPPKPLAEGFRIELLHDQHARLLLPPGAELAIGDLVGCGVSHPCTAFDKWRLLYVVDDAYRVVDAVRTFF